MKEKTAPSDGAKQLFDDICAFLARHPGIEDDSIRKLAYFAFAVLFPELAPTWPFLWASASDAGTSTSFLRMLQGIFLEPVHVANITLAGLMSLPASIHRVLLIDQPTPEKECLRVLRTIGRPGAAVLWKGQAREISCPVVLCTAEPLTDAWLLDQAIHVQVLPTPICAPKCDSQSMATSIRALRGRLGAYRERNLGQVRDSTFDAPEFRSPTRKIVQLLGSAVVDDPALQAKVVPLLKPQDRDAQSRRENSPRTIVVEAGLTLCHEKGRTQARVGEFATIVNEIFEGRGEGTCLEARAVGDLLRSLGLFSERLGRAGRGIKFTREVRERIHWLALTFSARSLQDVLDRCEYCAVFQNGAKRAS